MTHEPPARAAPLHTRIVTDVAAWDAIRADWNRLHAMSPNASTPLDFVWLRQWWNVYGPIYGHDGLRIITLWRDDELVGALPLYLGRGVGGPLAARYLRFISTGESEDEETCPDYLGLLHLPGSQVACARAVWAAVDAMRWDVLEWLDLTADSPLLRERSHSVAGKRVRVIDRGGCPVAELVPDFETYLNRLSAKTRQRARQELRSIERAKAIFELATATSTDAFFDDLIRLHQQRWNADGKPGCFAAARFTAFHRQLLGEWAGSERLVLARLSHGDKVGVVLYGFVTGTKFDLYQLGVQAMDGVAIHSPGIAANLLLMRAMTQRGVAHYDFLRGSSPFKQSLTHESRALVAITCRRWTARAVLDHAFGMAMRAARKAIRQLRVRLKHVE